MKGLDNSSNALLVLQCLLHMPQGRFPLGTAESTANVRNIVKLMQYSADTAAAEREREN